MPLGISCRWEKWSSKDLKRSLSRFILIVFLALGASCATTSVDDFCGSRLGSLNEKIDNALVVLRSWEPDRSLASVDEHTRHPLSIDLAFEDRRSWSAWALERLKEMQVYGDATQFNPQLRVVRGDLTSIANEWVSFDGYATLSQVDRMIVMLDRIRHENDAVIAKVCPATGHW